MAVINIQCKVGMLVLAGVLAQGCSVTDQEGLESSSNSPVLAAATADGNSSYVESSSNEVVVSSKGECVRTSSWDSDVQDGRCMEIPVADKTPGSVLVSFNGRALFDFDSSVLTAPGRLELDQLTAKLDSQTEIEAIEIVGHADSVGTNEYNLALSEERADVVMKYLQRSLRSVSVTARGVGESVPAASNDTEAGRRENRRVDVKVAAKVEQ